MHSPSFVLLELTNSEGQDLCESRARTYYLASTPPDERLRPACYCRLSKPRRQGKADAQLFKLRVRSAYRHLVFLPGVLRGRLATSARNLNVNLPGRVHSPPGLNALGQSCFINYYSLQWPIRQGECGGIFRVFAFGCGGQTVYATKSLLRNSWLVGYFSRNLPSSPMASRG